LSYPASSSSFYRKAISGATPVEVVDKFILKDKWRDREIPVKIYYPQEEGSFPAIIFSHGAGGSKDSFSYLGRFWASCGYVCIHPTHLGSDISIAKKIGLQALLEITNDPEFWSERPQDISFLIDSLENIEQQVPQLKGKINQSFIGVAGHSYGAYTSMLLAGAVITMPSGDEVSFRDDRTTVFLAISPQGTNRLGLKEHSWAKINAPTMTVSGSKDQGWEGNPASWRLEAFKSMPRGDKYHVLVEGANHFSFDLQVRIAKNIASKANRGNKNSEEVNLFELDRNSRIRIYLQSASIAFWDAYLKLKKPGKEYLWSDALKIDSNGEVAILLK
jgi:predicted dienelactone hydrolase